MKVAAVTTAPTTTRLFQPKLVDRCSQSEIVKFLEHRLFGLRSSTDSNDLDLNNQKILWLQSIFQFERTVTDLNQPPYCKINLLIALSYCLHSLLMLLFTWLKIDLLDKFTHVEKSKIEQLHFNMSKNKGRFYLCILLHKLKCYQYMKGRIFPNWNILNE